MLGYGAFDGVCVLQDRATRLTQPTDTEDAEAKNHFSVPAVSHSDVGHVAKECRHPGGRLTCRQDAGAPGFITDNCPLITDNYGLTLLRIPLLPHPRHASRPSPG